MAEKFNYAIGTYWEGDRGNIGAYMIHSNEIFYGTRKQAEETLKYVQREAPDSEWKIFVLSEIEPEK
jgi:hypothetical protein